MAHLSYSSRTGWSLVRVNSTTEKNQVLGNTFSIMDNCNHQATTKWGRLLVGGNGYLKDADVRPGSRFILEYGISQYISERLEISLQGGHTWQVGDDSGADVNWDTSIKDQMSIVGGGVRYWLKPNRFYVKAKYSTTYNNQ